MVIVVREGEGEEKEREDCGFQNAAGPRRPRKRQQGPADRSSEEHPNAQVWKEERVGSSTTHVGVGVFTVKLVSRNNRCCPRNNHRPTLVPRRTIHEAGQCPNRAAASTMQGQRWDSRLVYACGTMTVEVANVVALPSLGREAGYWTLQTRRDMT
jgi:hypothetical protein